MRTRHPKSYRAQSGLTLVEMLVASTLLVAIMLGLTVMFNQTQRAFRSGLKQVDVFEGGRAVADLIARDVQSINDRNVPNGLNFFFGDYGNDLIQDNVGSPRTNQFQYLFGQNQVGADWVGVGYCFQASKVDGLMDLYRFTKQANSPYNNSEAIYRTALRDLFRGAYPTNVHRVAEGIVHLKFRAFNKDGIEILPGATYLSFPSTNFLKNVSGQPVYEVSRLPGSLEVEIGILEPQTLEQAKSVADPRTYLHRQAGKVHIFRQQIPIRNAPR